MKKEIVKSCTTCGKIQEGNTDGNWVILKGNDCECGGMYEFSFK